MKPAAFAYHDPTTVDEAVTLLREYGTDAKVLAGGQSLVPMMNFRLARPQHVIDLMKVQGLVGIARAGGVLRIGAMTTHAAIEGSPLVAAACPLLPAAAAFIGHVQIRARGTFGGSIAHADPAAEWPMCLAALGGSIRVRSAGGERSIGAGEFFISYFTTTMAPDELVVGVDLNLPAPGDGWSIQEVARRHGDFALVAVAATVRRDGDRISAVRLALGGCGGIPVDGSAAAAEVLAGEPASDAALAEAGRRVAALLEPDGDIHATAEYRVDVAAELVRRALHEAWCRSAGAETEGGRP